MNVFVDGEDANGSVLAAGGAGDTAAGREKSAAYRSASTSRLSMLSASSNRLTSELSR